MYYIKFGYTKLYLAILDHVRLNLAILNYVWLNYIISAKLGKNRLLMLNLAIIG
jgi:hypothetical protein